MVISDAAGVEIAPPGLGKDVKMAKATLTLVDEFSFDGQLGKVSVAVPVSGSGMFVWEFEIYGASIHSAARMTRLLPQDLQVATIFT